MEKIFIMIFISFFFLGCSNLKQKEACISKISYLEEKPTVPLPPAIQIEIRDYKNIISEKINVKKLKTIIISSNRDENKVVIPFNQEIGFTTQFLRNNIIKLTAITYKYIDTINNPKRSEIEEELQRSNIDFVFGNETLRIQKCN